MNKKPSNSIAKPFMSIVKRFHLTIFFVFVIALLISGVILINQTLTEGEAEGSNYTSSIDAGSIDEATLQRLQALHPSSDTGETTTVPEGRINPFDE